MEKPKDVEFFVKNHIGWIRLNRKKALNALSFEMIEEIQKNLVKWETDLDVYAVYISSAIPHVFCAGGDVKSLYQHHIEKDDQYQALYLAKQYLMDYHIHTYKKPVIVYVDGIVYGGGVGLATAAKYMILSENAQMAMPETKIGFFPDVGTSRLLNDLPNQVGRYLGLLGVAMNTSDIIDLKITKYMISHDTWKFIEDKLKTLTLNKDDINERLEKLFLEHVGKLNHHSDFMKHMNQIKCIFSKKDINEMLLEIDKNDFFELKILDRLNEMSPTALFVTHKLLQKTQKMTLYECFKFEHSLSKNIIKTHDFKEGVRSLLIDKDKKFDYQPSKIKEVLSNEIEKLFDFEDINKNHMMDQLKGLHET